MKYIDAEELKVEIDRQKIGYNIDGKHDAEYDTCVKIVRIIDSLQQEQPEVDLEKEYKEYVEDDPVFSKLTNRNVGLAVARHFFNLGLNQKEENK